MNCVSRYSCVLPHSGCRLSVESQTLNDKLGQLCPHCHFPNHGGFSASRSAICQDNGMVMNKIEKLVLAAIEINAAKRVRHPFKWWFLSLDNPV